MQYCRAVCVELRRLHSRSQSLLRKLLMLLILIKTLPRTGPDRPSYNSFLMLVFSKPGERGGRCLSSFRPIGCFSCLLQRSLRTTPPRNLGIGGIVGEGGGRRGAAGLQLGLLDRGLVLMANCTNFTPTTLNVISTPRIAVSPVAGSLRSRSSGCRGAQRMAGRQDRRPAFLYH